MRISFCRPLSRLVLTLRCWVVCAILIWHAHILNFVFVVRVDTYFEALIVFVSLCLNLLMNIFDQARDLITRLLEPRSAARLGCLAGGWTDVLAHPFFCGISIEALERKVISSLFWQFILCIGSVYFLIISP